MAALHPLVKMLLAERRQRGLTRVAVCDMADIPDVTLWRWESGKNEPNLPGMTRWAAALGYDLALTRKEAD